MSKRLQVLVDEQEFEELQAYAEARGMTLSDWVRQQLRRAKQLGPKMERDRKLAAIRSVVTKSQRVHPPCQSPDIDRMLHEVSLGYSLDLPE